MRTDHVAEKIIETVRQHPRWSKDEIGTSLGLQDREFDLIDNIRQRELYAHYEDGQHHD